MIRNQGDIMLKLFFFNHDRSIIKFPTKQYQMFGELV